MTVFYHFLLSIIIGLCFVFEAWACEPFPTNVRFSDIQVNSAVVSWEKLGVHYVYQVSWREKNTTVWNTSPILPANKDQYRLQSLREGIEYEVQVRSKCISKPQFSPYAPTSLGFLTQSRTCAESQPSPPKHIGIRSIGENQATVMWENLPDAAGLVVSYAPASHRITKLGTDTTRLNRVLEFVQTDVDATVTAVQWTEILLCSENRSTVLRNLQANTRYAVRLRTLCDNCQTQGTENKSSKWSDEVEFTTLNEGDLVLNAVVSGKVYDELLRPVAHAQVTIGRQTTQTNAQGRYYLPFARQERTLVKVEHPDFVTRTVGFYPTQADTVYCSVLMDQFKITHTFNGRDGMLLGNTAFTVQLPENSIIDERTRLPYTGTVKACITSSRPGDPLFGERMPGGDFLAINSQGEERVLYSYGFFGCELRGESNQPLNLAPGKKAQVSFQITAEQEAKTLPTMPLWHYDEEESIWKEEGFTTKYGNTYIGEVSHFSSWNCDWPGKRAWVEGHLTLCGGNTAKGGIVYADYLQAEADNTGFYRRWIPAGFPSPISIYTHFSEERYELASNLQTDQTITVPNLDFNPIRAVGIARGDSLELFASVIGAKDTLVNFEYSLDRTTWQRASKFTHLPEQDRYTGYVRAFDMPNCIAKVVVTPVNMLCQKCDLKPYMLNYTNLTTIEYLNRVNQYSQDYLNCNVFHPQEFQLLESSFEEFRCVNSLRIFFPVSSSFVDKITTFRCLQSLELNFVNGDQIPESIGKLVNLRDLKVHGRNPSLPSTIGNLAQLIFLDLSNNSITSLPKEIGNCTKLETLILKSNALNTLPIEIGNLTKLKSLDLNHNRTFRSLPKEIGNCAELETLNVYDCPLLTSLPAEIGNCTKLKSLSLQLGGLTALPTEIRNCTKLESLNLTFNALTSLPAEIGNCTLLKTLIVKNNSLTTLPAEIGNCINLEYLNLAYNNLTALPAEIGNCTLLKNLILHNNSLTTLPAEIGNCTNLLELLVHSNHSLRSLPAEIGNCAKLETLLVNSCLLLNSIPAEIGNCINLKNLQLGNIPLLSRLPVEIGNCTKLETLALSNSTLLTSLPAEIGNCTKLETLALHHLSSLSSLPPEIANLKDSLKKLVLQGCPISEEEKARIRAWLPNTTITF